MINNNFLNLALIKGIASNSGTNPKTEILNNTIIFKCHPVPKGSLWDKDLVAQSTKMFSA
jgi:hypothetical protein